jgi:DNA-binding LacI/PurR family transcriptional regulator
MPAPRTTPSRTKEAERSGRASKTEETRERLLALARDLGPDAQLPPVRDLQGQLGVSYSTLDAALSELERRRAIVRRHGSGIFVSPRLHQRTVYLICNPVHLYLFGESPFWRMLLEYTRDRAGEQDVHFHLHFARSVALPSRPAYPPDPSELSESLRAELTSGQVQGVISVGLDHPTTRWIEAQGVPVVSFAGAAGYIVNLSNEEAVRLGVEELARQGARRVALWTPCSPSPPRHLTAVFRAALTARGLPFDPADVQPAPSSRPVSEDPAWTGYRYAESLFHPDGSRDDSRWPDAILSTDDMVTQGVLMAFQRRGVRVGADVRVATHANAGSPALLGWLPSLTRMEFDPGLLARVLFDTLTTLLDGGTPDTVSYPDVPEKFVTLYPRLIRPGETSP